jgi:hypothetical protein
MSAALHAFPSNLMVAGQTPNLDVSQESKFSLPHQLSRADFGNLLFELCAKLGINNLNNEQDDISPKVLHQRGFTNPLFKIECI